ncbi:MAG TPA: CU044_2847 family protein [Anaerolineae bacterium]|nr:CU044_2847 family protein [Anaerolineae bacterium]
MDNYAELMVGDQTIYVEVTPSAKGGWQEARRLTGPAELGEKLTLEFDKMMGTVRTAALGFRDGLNKLEKKTRPDEATLEFGLTLGGEAGVAVVAKATGEFAFKVSLTWKNSKVGG